MRIGLYASNGECDLLTRGSIFDHKGNLRNWWTKTTKEKFLEKADCFSKQYGESDSWLPFAIDGNVTLGENIADNGGLRNAFKAFKLHLALADEHLTNRKILSGLSASPEQLFFIGYASIWCANMTEEFESRFGTSDPHNHPKLRVNVPLANSKEFARAFKCKSGTPMNPRRKCVLW
nr:neprilysin-1-like [Parasteatoda tepidariorum]